MPITVPQDMIKENIYDAVKHFKIVYDYLIKSAIMENGWNPIYLHPSFLLMLL